MSFMCHGISLLCREVSEMERGGDTCRGTVEISAYDRGKFGDQGQRLGNLSCPR